MNRGTALKIFYFFERDVDRGSGSFAAGCLLAVLSIVFMIGVPALLPAYFMSYSIEEAEKVAMAFVLGSGLLTLVIAATALTLCCKTSRSFSDLFISCFCPTAVVSSIVYCAGYWTAEGHTSDADIVPMIFSSLIMCLPMFAMPAGIAASIVFLIIRRKAHVC